jgi:DinB superfamily
MDVERCAQCGFDAGHWTDDEALAAVADMPGRWVEAIDGVSNGDLLRRPIPGTWSIAEYADHLREVFFGMRFLLDTAVTAPGTDLGPPPSSRFDPEPRPIDVAAALAGLADEAATLQRRFTQLTPAEWSATVTLDGAEVGPHWIVRHAVHDATHHLGDVARLRAAL